MQIPDIPTDEAERLKTLHAIGVLDTPPEARFDRLTRMARRLFQVPIATVSLIDVNRQWFKSCAGLDATETGRDVSFCGHAILGNDVFVIPDARADERFADNPLVLDEPHVRFYAGCPLSAPNGLKMGTLCLIDQAPRDFEAEDIELLTDLAAMVERELFALELATQDELTGIANRRGFLMLAEQTLHVCAREKLTATLVYMDMNRLKPINDQRGHAEGDRALRLFARAAERILRDSDLVGRLGGDEFAALLVHRSGVEASEVMQRLDQSLNEAEQLKARGYPISFSFGAVEFDPSQHQTIHDLLARGDGLMYAHKASSR